MANLTVNQQSAIAHSVAAPAPFIDLPTDVLGEICVRLHSLRDVTNFFRINSHLASVIKKTAESEKSLLADVKRGTQLKDTPVTARPAVAVKYLLKLGPRLRPALIHLALNTLPISREEEAMGIFERDRERRSAAAVLLARGKTEKAEHETLINILHLDDCSGWEITLCASNLLSIFEPEVNRRMATDALLGLWKACTSSVSSDKDVVYMAKGICETMREKMAPPSTSVLIHIVASPRIKTVKNFFIDLKLGEQGESLATLKPGSCSLPFKNLIKGMPYLGKRSGEELLQYLCCFSRILPAAGKSNRFVIEWLLKTIALARQKNVAPEQIQQAIPSDLFNEKEKKYLLRAAAEGNFDDGRLQRIRKHMKQM